MVYGFYYEVRELSFRKYKGLLDINFQVDGS